MFQTSIQVTQAPGQAGDFASMNPRHSAISVPGGFRAGPNGLTIGVFAWADTVTGSILSNTGTGPVTAFIHRTNQATLIGVGMGPGPESSYTIMPNKGVGEMFSGGDFFCVNAGTAATTIGMKAFASLSNGTVSFAAPGATVTGSVETKFYCYTINAAGELVIISSMPIG
jgi:hypothetical protein